MRPGGGRRCPRSSGRARPRARRPRSGRRRWRRRSGSRAGRWARAATYRGAWPPTARVGGAISLNRSRRRPLAAGGSTPGHPATCGTVRDGPGLPIARRRGCAAASRTERAHRMASVVSGSKKCRCSRSYVQAQDSADVDRDVGRHARGEASAHEVGGRVSSANLARDFELVLGEHRRSVDGRMDQQVGAQRLDQLDGGREHLVVVVAGGCGGTSPRAGSPTTTGASPRASTDRGAAPERACAGDPRTR